MNEAVAYKLYRHNAEENGFDPGSVDQAWIIDPDIRAFWREQVALVHKFTAEASQ